MKDLNIITLTNVHPNPTSVDYDNGFMYRYFSKLNTKTNNLIYEIDEKQYKSVSNIPYYYTIKVVWLIVGLVEYVATKNNDTLLYYDNEMPGLYKKYVKTVVEFLK
jgi:hypothetical protein